MCSLDGSDSRNRLGGLWRFELMVLAALRTRRHFGIVIGHILEEG
jgi:hypothetical protein